ncbi:uncharacterized protein EI97DRAFT_458926 [Westerdykella ornata]|uniref:Peptidase S8/S53 domain-containing protein n=1 Tax=Westerdykella ornata TaxID=318751 RepID=A0A6A6JIZ7_WESOR|nr:uncharacterized protein EI97DRAFT_458926 [Westerdykella ornata]KAF2275928.1 hypothetical protein EI97DRAFT_458926 [Westerdykella ornata]
MPSFAPPRRPQVTYGFLQGMRKAESHPITSAQDVVDDVKKLKIDFQDSASYGPFRDKHLKRLERGQTTGSSTYGGGRAEDEVLHIIAKDTDGREFHHYADFTAWAIKNYRPLLQCRDAGGYQPLHLALMNQNHAFVFMVLERASEVRALLEDYSMVALTCLHRAIWHRSPFTEAILDKVMETGDTERRNQHSSINDNKNASSSDGGINPLDDIFTACSTDHIRDAQRGCPGMTPLHFAATSWLPTPDDDEEYDRCQAALREQKRSVVNRVESPSQISEVEAKNSTPPHVTRVKRDSLIVTCPVMEADKFFKTGVRKLDILDDASDPHVKRFREAVGNLLGAATTKEQPRTLPNRPKRFDLLAIVKKLIKARPDVLLKKHEEGSTPFQARLDAYQEQDADVVESELTNGDPMTERNDVSGLRDDKERQDKIVKDPVLHYMREYIVSNYGRRDAMKALYRPGEERVLEFNLVGLPHPSVDSDFLDGLGNVLRFEGLLKEVAIPRLIVKNDEEVDLPEDKTDSKEPGKNGEPQAVDKIKGKGRTDMYSIFKWLRENHVGSILKVTVVDDLEPCHSDQAIEACMAGFDVRVWNWYKVDLSCQVILNSARNVTNVTLYSSGNNAVLMGWSSSSGLAMLPKLKVVHINVQEGLERPKRLQAYMKTFGEELKKQKPDVVFTWKRHTPSQNYDDVFAKQGTERITESKWWKSVEEFGAFLEQAQPSHPVDPIKIAIIDDGINTALDIFSGRIQGGESFAPLSEFSGRAGAYYVPSGPHGTLMAQLICKVCPVVKLYIAQLEVLPGQNGRRSFTPESATEAIEWAIERNVDIISMSWSIRSDDRQHKGLDEALQDAANQGISMFCSSIDEGPTAPDNTYPGKNTSCIKIGAATATGTVLSWVSESKSDFLLPGESPQLTPETKLWGKLEAGLSGSSIATAVAAGIAGVLIYCERLLAPRDPRGPDPLRASNNMKNAFKNLSKNDRKFVPIWRYLPKLSDQEQLVLDEKYNPDKTNETREKLKAFIDSLYQAV